MQKKTLIKLGGFVAAAAATAALVGFAANGTGAYFSDSHPGTITAGTGNLSVTVSPTDGVLDFGKLMPGEYGTANLSYTAHTTDSTNGEDIWFVITPPVVSGSPQDTSCTNDETLDTAEILNGPPDDMCKGGLGRYGHFAVSTTQGYGFTSYNLNTAGTTPTHTGNTCSTDPFSGNGGSNTQAVSRVSNDPANLIDFCPVPNAILLASGLTDGQGGTATFTFGFTPLLTAPQNGTDTTVASYKIVATQHGISPSNINN